MGISGRLLEVTHITQVSVAQLVTWPCLTTRGPGSVVPSMPKKERTNVHRRMLKKSTVNRNSKAPLVSEICVPHECWI